MARVLGFLAGVAVLFGAATPACAEKPRAEEKTLKIGLLQPMFKDVPQALINAAAKPFEAMIKSKTGMKGTLQMVPDYKELAESIKAGKIDVAVFHGFEYAWVKDTPGLQPLVVAVPNCGTVQACLVVNKKSEAKTPACLKGACVLMPKGTKAHCAMYLEHLRGTLPSAECCQAKREEVGVEEALFALGGGKADAALVDISALKALETNYPGCYRQLRVLAESKPLPAAVVVYRDGSLNSETVKKLREGLLDCVKSSEGYAFTVFWQLKGFAEVSPAYNSQVKNCLENYPAPGEIMNPEPRVPSPR